MVNPLKYYQEHLKKYQSESKRLYKKMTAFSLYRLAIFLSVVFGIYFTFKQWQLASFAFKIYRYKTITRF